MKYCVTHCTTYDYEAPVLHGRQIVLQRPRELPYQRVISSAVEVLPVPSWRHACLDHYGNRADFIEVLEPHERLVVTTSSQLEVGPRDLERAVSPFDQNWEAVRDELRGSSDFEAREMTLASPMVPLSSSLAAFALETFGPGRSLLEALLAFNHAIFEGFSYESTATDVATPVEEVLRERSGVCQDFAQLAIAALRSIGLSARYVSGYLETLPPPGQPRLVGADASHAWFSVYFPDFGWVDFDPTNNLLPGERHVVVAWGRDYSDVSPLRGVVQGGGRHTVSVSVDVAPLD